MSATDRLAQLGLTLPPPPKPLGNYVPFRIGGNMLFLSGVGPRRPDGSMIAGTVGQDVSIEQAYEAARLCGLNLLGNMHAALGSLDRVDTVLKVLGMVNAAPGFGDHPKVIDGCTDLFVDVFGDAGRPARSAVGMGSLPRNIAVEIGATGSGVAAAARACASGSPLGGRRAGERRPGAAIIRPGGRYSSAVSKSAGTTISSSSTSGE